VISSLDSSSSLPPPRCGVASKSSLRTSQSARTHARGTKPSATIASRMPGRTSECRRHRSSSVNDCGWPVQWLATALAVCVTVTASPLDNDVLHRVPGQGGLALNVPWDYKYEGHMAAGMRSLARSRQTDGEASMGHRTILMTGDGHVYTKE
jgi:hypothetical protein